MPHMHLVCQKINAKVINVDFQEVKKSKGNMMKVYMELMSGVAAAKPFKLLVQNLDFQ